MTSLVPPTLRQVLATVARSLKSSRIYRLLETWIPYINCRLRPQIQPNNDSKVECYYWRQMLEPQLENLLSASGYQNSSSWLSKISSLLDSYRVLGPRPNSQSPSWPSFLSDDLSPIEYSLSISPKNMTIRFAFEPVSQESGRSSDPVNSRTPATYLKSLLGRYAFDTTWLAPIREALMVTSGLIDIPDKCKGLTQEVFAFDLEASDPRLKIYAMPDAKIKLALPEHQQERRDEIIDIALAQCGFSEAWQPVNEYLHHLHSTQPDSAGYAEALGWDAVDPIQARMKVYVRFKEANLQDILNHLDLGGKLRSAWVEEIKLAASEMWNVFGPREVLTFEDLAVPVNRTGGALLAYEFRRGKNEPCAVKCMYPPLCRQLMMNIMLIWSCASLLPCPLPF